ncbi:hypothetical protein GOP47_0021431 [Adiantum capillus-veneris]|uniref:Uncharacterized protein n=1 Tax=Adiantum capillus-veneris TaxID=13818 RepID=A0A9D4U7C4_ADICA|nr:hypothetical protein GOP47_0021431 [Adiantum capillus-veneris]
MSGIVTKMAAAIARPVVHASLRSLGCVSWTLATCGGGTNKGDRATIGHRHTMSCFVILLVNVVSLSKYESGQRSLGGNQALSKQKKEIEYGFLNCLQSLHAWYARIGKPEALKARLGGTAEELREGTAGAG